MKSLRSTLALKADYGDLIGLIPSNPKFSPSDLDGICERKGYFLVMEWKRPGEKASDGQKRLLQALAANPRFMVVVVIGNTDNGTVVDEFWQYAPDGKCFLAGKGFNSFKEFYRLWYEFADGH
jgi:hypothetical protein